MEPMECDTQLCVPVNLGSLKTLKLVNETNSIINLFRNQPPHTKRKRLGKRDVQSILKGKILADFKVDLASWTALDRPSSSGRNSADREKEKSTPKIASVKESDKSKLSSPDPSARKPCPHCGSRRFRVVDPGRPDGKRVLECARRKCLASIRYSVKPEGTMIGETPEEDIYGWYLRHPAEYFYPRTILDKNCTFGRDLMSPGIHDEEGRVCIPCPGQKEFVPVL